MLIMAVRGAGATDLTTDRQAEPDFFRRLALLFALALMGASFQALAQPSPPPANSAIADRNLQMASEIAQLRDGTLDPSIDADSLFELTLAGRRSQIAQAVVRLVLDDEFYSAAKEDQAALAPLSANEATLAMAQAGFLRLPQSRQDRILDAHRARSRDAQSRQDELQAKQTEATRLEGELAGLRNFLAGNPTNLKSLDIDLIHFMDNERATEVLKSPAGQQARSEAQPPKDADIDTRLEWLRSQVLVEKARALSLPPDRLNDLLANSGISASALDEIADADAALEAAQTSLQTAELQAAAARDEQSRLLATEHAELLAVARSQAETRAELARMNAQLPQVLEEALGWRRRVEELVGSRSASDDADRAYDALVADLNTARERLRRALAARERLAAENIYPDPIDPVLEASLGEAAELQESYLELEQSADRISREYADTIWSRRVGMHDAVTRLNEARLALIPALSSRKRSQILGYGSQGIAQVHREIDQIALNFRYYAKSWPRLISQGLEITPKLVFDLSWMVLAVLIFGSWRRRGDLILAHAFRAARSNRRKNVSSAIKARFIEFWRRIRRPLDWLILLVVLNWLWPPELDFAGSQIIWLVLIWSAAALFLLVAVNELAHGTRRTDPRAELRLKSLRLAGGALLAVILILEISQAIVGRGAIYNWVTNLAWLLVPILALILTRWWQDRIKTLAEAEAERSTFLAWIARRPATLSTVLPYSVAGVYLLLKGGRSAIARQISGVALVREINQQRVREQAAKQVAEDKASGRYKSLPPEIRDALAPHREAKRAYDERPWPGGLDQPRIRPGNIIAIVGDRGLGKSTMLSDLAGRDHSYDRCIQLKATSEGLDGILRSIAEAMELEDETHEADALRQAMVSSGQSFLITIDDIQRMIVPAIGGMSEFERLIEFARGLGARSTWVMSIESVAWDYLRRARFDRLMFDAVVRLPHWPLQEIREIIERRTQQAGIDPDFESVMDVGVFGASGDLSVDQRKRLGYFETLYDYADGNPAVALEYWRRSLFVVEDSEKIVVLTFARPASEKLSALPMSVLFVLRAILQMDRADPKSIGRATDLPIPIVDDALRRLRRIDAVQENDGEYRISIQWWLEVYRLLERRNLIMLRKP